jgi:hypothetical protein
MEIKFSSYVALQSLNQIWGLGGWLDGRWPAVVLALSLFPAVGRIGRRGRLRSPEKFWTNSSLGLRLKANGLVESHIK